MLSLFNQWVANGLNQNNITLRATAKKALFKETADKS
jgi:hypothetical protein